MTFTPIPEPDRIYHVTPSFEGEPEHSTSTDEPCWCEPRIDYVQGRDEKWGAVYIHNRPS